MKNVDTFIVGQGLAGSLLAWHLIQSGQQVYIVDDKHPNAASRVAAGLINPITGRRLVKSWKLDIFHPYALQQYNELEKYFSQPFYFNKSMVQVFTSQMQYTDWKKRCDDMTYKQWLGPLLQAGGSGHALRDEFGSSRQLRSGYLDVTCLLDRFSRFLAEKKLIDQQAFKYSDLDISGGFVTWKDVRAKRLVFCEGYRGVYNPWFSGAGFNPVQGDILTFTTTAEMPDEIINKGKWLLPLSRYRYRLGATYQRDYRANNSAMARKELLLSLQQMLSDKHTITVDKQHTGIRPASVDRRPILGSHPDYPELTIFNGFGSKGTLMIPYYAQLFTNYLIHGGELPKDVDVARFHQLCA